MKPWMPYALAFLLFLHGFIYVRVGSMLPDPIKEWTGTSWLLGHAVSDRHLGTLAVGLHVVAGMALIACAAAIGVPWLVPGWWRPLAMIGGALGVAAFAVFWDGQTRLLVEEGALGALISLALLVGAIFLPLAFR
jgi:hypothetical protein